MRIDSRRESLFAKIHGRYRTIGFADVAAGLAFTGHRVILLGRHPHPVSDLGKYAFLDCANILNSVG